MKTLFICNDQSNQRALANKLASQVNVDGIVIIEGKSATSRTSSLIRRSAGFIAGLPLRRAWFAMLRHYERHFPRFPQPPLLRALDVNDPEVFDLIAQRRPDLVIVSGTNLLKQPLISKIQEFGKVINLHTGISPYVKGAPNCTNWCLALGRFDLIGNTVMWIDAGIDSGNLIATERTPLTGGETLAELHIAVMEHAHALYVRCARLILDGVEVSNVPQDKIAAGKLYRLRDWNLQRVLQAVRIHSHHYRKDQLRRSDRPKLLLVSPTEGVTTVP